MNGCQQLSHTVITYMWSNQWILLEVKPWCCIIVVITNATTSSVTPILSPLAVNDRPSVKGKPGNRPACTSRHVTHMYASRSCSSYLEQWLLCSQESHFEIDTVTTAHWQVLWLQNKYMYKPMPLLLLVTPVLYRTMTRDYTSSEESKLLVSPS